jgi:hypothetical protein
MLLDKAGTPTIWCQLQEIVETGLEAAYVEWLCLRLSDRSPRTDRGRCDAADEGWRPKSVS